MNWCVFLLLVLGVQYCLGSNSQLCLEATAIFWPGETHLVLSGVTTNSTLTNDPDPLCGSLETDGGSVWYTFLSGTNNHLLLSTCSQDGGRVTFDTKITLYDSHGCDEVYCVAHNDDGCNSGGSRIDTYVVSNRRYYFSVSGGNGGRGNFQLYFKLDRKITKPENDECDNAIPIPSGPVIIQGSTVFSTSTFQSTSCLNGGIAYGSTGNIWYSFFSSSFSHVLASMCTHGGVSDYEATLVLMDGSNSCAFTNLTCVAYSSNDCGISPRLYTNLIPNTPYYLGVGGGNGAHGQFSLYFELLNPTIPPNSICSGALPASFPLISGSLLFSYETEDEFYCNGPNLGEFSLWYTFTSASNNYLFASLCDNGAYINADDSALFLGQGDSCPGTCLFISASSCRVSYPLDTNTNYYLGVTGNINYSSNFTADDLGAFQIYLELRNVAATIPENENCSRAIVLQTNDIVSGSTVFATNEFTVSCAHIFGQPDVWYQFDSGLNNNNVVISMCSEDGGFVEYDASIALLEGCTSCVSVSKNSCANSAPRLEARITPQTIYFISISGFGSGAFQFYFGLSSLSAASNENCVGALALPNSQGSQPTAFLVEITNTSAIYDSVPITASCGNFFFSESLKSFWYTFQVVGIENYLTISTCGHGSVGFEQKDTVSSLYLFEGNSCSELTCLEVSYYGCIHTNSPILSTNNITSGAEYTIALVTNSNASAISFWYNVGFYQTLRNSCSFPYNVPLAIGIQPISIDIASSGLQLNGIVPECVPEDAITNGWLLLSMPGSGEYYVEISSCNSDFSGYFQLYDGACSFLNCIATSKVNYVQTCLSGPPGYGIQLTAKITAGQGYLLSVFGVKNSAAVFEFQIETYPAGTPVPSNDLCANAIPLNSPTNSGLMSGTVSYSTIDNVQTLSESCITTEYGTRNVWYTFDSEYNNFILLTMCQFGGFAEFKSTLFLLRGDCDLSECIQADQHSCSDGRGSQLLSPIDTRTNYYISLTSVSDEYFTGSATFSFYYELSFITPPSNDDCFNAIPISIPTQIIEGEITFSTLDSTVCNPNPEGSNVWYSFESDGYNLLTLSRCSSGSIVNFDANILLLSGSCVGVTGCDWVQFNCTTNIPIIPFSSYLLGVSAISDFGYTFSDYAYVPSFSYQEFIFDYVYNIGRFQFNFSLSIISPASESDCRSPGIVPLNSQLNGNTDFAYQANPVFCSVPMNGALWYSIDLEQIFTPFINVTVLSADFDIIIYLVTGSCALQTPDCVAVSTDKASILEPLISMPPYYLAIGGYYSSGSFEILVEGTGTLLVFPVNDDCVAAIDLLNGLGNVGDLNYATADFSSGSCNSLSLTGAGVWFKFVTSTHNYVTLSTCSPGSSTFPTRIFLFKADASDCSDSALVNSCVSGQNYQANICGRGQGAILQAYVDITTSYLVFVTSDTQYRSEFDLNFELSVSLSPLNDECSDAITLTDKQPYVFGSVYLSTYSTPQNNCFPTTATGNVWYQFNSEWYNTVFISTCSSPSLLDASFLLYAGSCTDVICITSSTACPSLNSTSTRATSNQLLQSFLKPQSNYLIAVVSGSSNSISESNFEFEFRLKTSSPPANDDCTNPTLLPPTPGFVSGNTLFATLDSASFCNNNTYFYPNVWYIYNSGSNNHFNVTDFASLRSPLKFVLYEGSCTSLTCVGESFNGFFAAETKLFTNYLLAVFDTTPYDQFTLIISDFNFAIGFESKLPPSNDECANAILLAIPTDTVRGDTLYSTFDSTKCGVVPDGDVWYTFNPGTLYNSVFASLCPSNGSSSFNSVVSLFSGVCGGEYICTATGTACPALGSELTYSGLVPNLPYFITVSGFINAQGTFQLYFELFNVVLPTPSGSPSALPQSPSSTPIQIPSPTASQTASAIIQTPSTTTTSTRSATNTRSSTTQSPTVTRSPTVTASPTITQSPTVTRSPTVTPSESIGASLSTTPSFNIALGTVLPPPPVDFNPTRSQTPSVAQSALVEQGETIVPSSSTLVSVPRGATGTTVVGVNNEGVEIPIDSNNNIGLVTDDGNVITINLQPTGSESSTIVVRTIPTTSYPTEEFASPIISITLYDEFGNEINLFSDPVRLCFSSSDSKDDSCLSYYDEDTKEWKCQDECLEENDEGLLWYCLLFPFIIINFQNTN